MMPVRFVFVAYHAASLLNETQPAQYGGAEVQLFLLAQALAKRSDCTVRFITASATLHNLQPDAGMEVDYRWHLTHRQTPWNIVRWGASLLKTLWASRGNVFVQRALGPETIVLRVYTWLFRKTFVYMVAHDWDVNQKFAETHGIIGRLAVWAMRHSDILVVQSQYQQTLVQQYYHRSSARFFTVYPITGVPLPQTDRATILWVGRAETWKQPEQFIALAQQFPQEHFTMIMPPTHDQTYYRQICQRIQQCRNITYYTHMSLHDIDAVFRSAKLFVNTSLYEGFPNTFIQAAKYGTPLLSLHVNPDDIIQRYSLGLVANGDPVLLADQLHRCITDPVLYDTYSQSAYRYAQQHHDIEVGQQVFFDLVLSKPSR